MPEQDRVAVEWQEMNADERLDAEGEADGCITAQGKLYCGLKTGSRNITCDT